jgi:methionyl-tRNA formyltransferase
MKPRVIFMGTPLMVVPTVEAIYNTAELVAVFSAPDKEGHRGKRLICPFPAQFAREHNIPCFQPISLKDETVVRSIEELKPDLIIVYAYGYILPQTILDIPQWAALNYHCSLLPKYRGASPIQSALLNGDIETGISVQRMVFKLDAGPLVLSKTIPIESEDDFLSLCEKTSKLNAELTPTIIRLYQENQVVEIPQDETQATYCTKIKKQDGCINWNQSATQIYNQIRAFAGWPQCFTYWNKKVLKILRAGIIHPSDCSNSDESVPGEVLEANKQGLMIQTGSGVLSIQMVQLENKKAMDYRSFLNGYPIEKGTVLKYEPI